MDVVKGTEGYSAVVQGFIAATHTVSFETLHAPYLDQIPVPPSHVLDVGAGIGRDASVLASMGHQVVAVEPTPEFLAAAKELHGSQDIQWIDGALPDLKALGVTEDRFDFILVSGVWHHLNDHERAIAMPRLAGMLRPGGVIAMSLRNGPAGAGTYVFPTDHEETIEAANSCGLEPVVVTAGLPSLMPGKPEVVWSKLAFKRL